jgi:hypothetical protein
MSSPTGSDPNYPQGAAPQGQPGWGAPQQPAPGYDPAPSYAGQPAGAANQRPGLITAAAIVGIVWGGLGALFSLLLMLAAFGLGAALAGLMLLLSLAVSVGLLVGGIQVLQGKSPQLLLFASYAAVAVGVLVFVVSLIATGGSVFNGVLGIVIAGAIAFLLMQPQTKQYYASRGISY